MVSPVTAYDQTSRVYWVVGEALVDFGAPAVGVLIAALADPNAKVRGRAADALG